MTSAANTSNTTGDLPSSKNCFFCSVCNVTCSGPGAYSSHLAGKQHHKMLTFRGEKLPPRILDNVATQDTYRCDICDTSMVGQITYETHVKGKKHLAKVAASASGGVSSSETFSCDLCGVKDVSKINYDNHVIGKKHKAKIRLSNATLGDKDETVSGSGSVSASHILPSDMPLLHCSTCSLDFTGSIPFSDHINGRKHKTKLRENEAGQLLRTSTSVDNIDDDLYCAICDCKCGNKDMKLQHLNGQKHQENVKEGRLFKAKTEKIIITDSYHCGLCDLKFNSSKVFDSHKLGSKHIGKMMAQGQLSNEPLNYSQEVGLRLLENGETFYCDLCREVIEHEVAAKVHITLTKHRNRADLVKQEQLHISVDEDGVERIERLSKDQGTLYCRFCGIQTYSKEEMDNHRETPAHKWKVEVSTNSQSTKSSTKTDKVPESLKRKSEIVIESFETLIMKKSLISKQTESE